MSTELQTMPADSSGGALALIREAMSSGMSPEHLEKLLAVKKDWEADESRKAYSRAVADFQGRCPIIEKADKAHDKTYARLDRIWRTIKPLMAELGLSVTWQICELRDQLCHVDGQLSHSSGHAQRLVQDIPLPELIKGQNRAQQMGSASTYAKRYALCAALGIVTGEDDDGNAAGTTFVTFDQAQEIKELVDACRGIPLFVEAKFWEWAGATTAEGIPAAKYELAKAALKKRLTGV